MPERFLASLLPQHEIAELYRLMVIGIKEVAVFLMNSDGLITVWNKGAEEMKGFTADDVIGQHLRLLYTDEDREAGRAEHNLQLAAEHGVFTEERWRRRKQGGVFWAHVVLTALRSDSGELLGFSKVTMDLTRHKQLEQCETEKREIDQILQAADSGTWRWQVDGSRVEVSRHLRELLGYAGDSTVIGFDTWLDYVHPDERAALRERLEQARARRASGPLEMELRLRRNNGSYQWFFMRANWHPGPPEQPTRLLGVCVAIDGLKLAEQEQRRLNRQLDQERARFSNILEQLPSGVVLAEIPSGRLTYQNRAAVSLLGREVTDIHTPEQYTHFHLYDVDGRRLSSDELPLTRTIRGIDPVARTTEMLLRRDDGRKLHLAVTTALVTDHDAVARIAVAVVHDISELKHAQLSAATEKERALVTLAAITDGVITVDRCGNIISTNPAAETLMGLSQEQARARPVNQAINFDSDSGAGAGGSALADAVTACLAERRVITGLPHLSLRGPDGAVHAVEYALAPVPHGGGDAIGAVLVLHDVTESKHLMRRLGFEASHDALTGLVNRREFEVRLQRAIERAHQSGGGSAALLYLDLDQFKIVNDTCGHPAGDDLLRQLARSYSEHVRERDTLARIGGDEFALIVEHCDVDHALAVAHKILDATRSFRYACNGRLFQLGVSIGLTPIDSRTAGVEEVMRRADHACYIAKERGRNRIYMHHHGDLDLAQRRSDMHWVTQLTHAFQHGQLQLYCQPIVALDGEPDTASYHYEILLRLMDAEARAIAPGAFLPAAERYDVILKIDRWVLSHTLEWLARHPEHTEHLGMCSINLSRRSLGDQSFHKFAADLIDASAVPADKLCFEITEHGAIADMRSTISFIEALSARGCRFSLDDFGTGMTSFSYLKELPVDYIKIDGSFIQTMASSEVDFEMVRFTNDISHMMGRKTIAEYVNDPAILTRLQQIGVDYAQGYWVGKPRPLAM